MPPRISKIFLEEGAGSSPFASRILQRLPRSPVEATPRSRRGESDPAGMEKDILLLSTFPGGFLKNCPGTKGYLCCGYQILHLGTNCPMDCSYCVLQAYLNQPYLRVFTNFEERLAALGDHLDAHQDTTFRIGTGEFMDSLALDPVVGWVDLLAPFFSGRRNAVLEFKTKTSNIERLMKLPFRDRIVVSWSLNSPLISSREEHGAPGVRKRIEAAKECQKEGFVVGFHFDPLVRHPGWRQGYLRTLEMMASGLDPKRIIWMSLGCMRYLPGLKPIIRRRRPGSLVLDGEFVPGLDGKMRLFKPIRNEMYGFMCENLGRWHKDLGLYLCMESPDVWQEAMGWNPGDNQGLSRYLDERVRRFFGEPALS